MKDKMTLEHKPDVILSFFIGYMGMLQKAFFHCYFLNGMSNYYI
jgi:hypothetical protein